MMVNRTLTDNEVVDNAIKLVQTLSEPYNQVAHLSAASKNPLSRKEDLRKLVESYDLCFPEHSLAEGAPSGAHYGGTVRILPRESCVLVRQVGNLQELGLYVGRLDKPVIDDYNNVRFMSALIINQSGVLQLKSPFDWQYVDVSRVTVADLDIIFTRLELHFDLDGRRLSGIVRQKDS